MSPPTRANATNRHPLTRRGPLAIAAAAIVAALACSSAPTTSPASAPGAGAPLTYFHDVKPIVDAMCTGCHVTGGLAPFPLTDVNSVLPEAAAMKSATSSRTMPPWLASPSCTTYQGAASLSDEQIKTISDWVNGGAAAGDASDVGAPLPPDPTTLDRVDSTLQMPVAYTPVTHPDEYRCFLIDWPQTTKKFITGFRARAGDAQIVHHVIAYAATPDLVPGFEQLNAGGNGWSCFGGPGGAQSENVGWVGAWVPGSAGGDFPAGTGIPIVPGSKIIVQVHYNTLTTPTGTDRTSLDFKLDDAVDKVAAIVKFTNPAWTGSTAMTIPAGDPNASYSFSADLSPRMSKASNKAVANDSPFLIYSTALHMHLLGTQASISVTHAGTNADDAGSGDSCLLDIPAWNFHWQRIYTFAKPVLFQPGDQVNLACHWNNSQANQQTVNGQQLPAKTVTWGEGTTDEMCLSVLYVTAP